MVVYATYTGPYSNSMCEPHVHSTYTSCVLYTYLYCVYALVGEAISTRDPYICANEWHAVFHSENVAIGFKTSIEVYFVEKNSVGTPELIEVSKLHHNFLNEMFLAKSPFLNRSCFAMNLMVPHHTFVIPMHEAAD